MKKNILLTIMVILILFLTGCTSIFHEHKFIINEVLPTCTEQGYIEEVCDCGEKNVKEFLNPLNHSFGEWVIENDSTFLNTGTMYKECKNCGQKESEEIAKKQYPDLGGYTIKIVVDTFNVDAYDPFNDLYNYYDKEEKQKAMREVEEKFNCTIKYVTYPESAEYGSVRWNYLLDEINNKTVEYDFCAVPNFVIPDFVKNGSIINLNEYYLKYGQNIMNNVQVASSTYKNDVYAICDARKHSTMIMVYNLELFRQLSDIDPTLKEPAQIYLEGNWTQTEFLKYCEKVQNAMEKLYGEKGKPGSEEQEYYVFSGWPTYLWTGLATSDEEPLLDINNMSENYTTESKIKAINLVRDLYDKNCIDPKFTFSGRSETFNNKKALFECRDIFDYFLSSSSTIGYKKSDFGFVLYPREDETAFSDVKIPLWDSKYYIMVNQNNYKNYGIECTSEYIYWAFSEYISLTNEYLEKKEMNLCVNSSEIENGICDSEASKKMNEYLQTKINNNEIYYEPIYDYLYVNTLFSNHLDFPTCQSLHTYITRSKNKTWEQLTFWVVEDLKMRLYQRYK